eukprot:CAMPEP_0118886442 /NCGR_PEP_ID=MMETSP1163-20130328/24527_1 /TAXON_ID=124430 /ORGANISM="Phaeomonas parva, Strain CCMP2877" /LENGTH=64 /DNA_ID=CAMNT_0006824657 /DNA_START=135 /DNA_END=329 /DNA_ORIENTATION=+
MAMRKYKGTGPALTLLAHRGLTTAGFPALSAPGMQARELTHQKLSGRRGLTLYSGRISNRWTCA